MSPVSEFDAVSPEDHGVGGMAGEEDDLLVPGEVTEEGGGGFLPLGIKIDEGIIEEKKSVPSLEKPACHGEAQGEPERGTGAGGEGGEGDLGRVAAGRLCEVRGEALITIEGERGEDFGEVGLPGCEGVGVEVGNLIRKASGNIIFLIFIYYQLSSLSLTLYIVISRFIDCFVN